MNLRYAAFLVTLLLSACKKEAPPSHMPQVVEVTEYEVAPKTIPAVFNFIGFAESAHQVEIRARVEGYLEEIAYQEGQSVKEGELLFQLDPKQFEAKVAESKAEVARQEAILANAKLTVSRLQPLYEKSAASRKDLDNAISNQLSAEAAVELAKAQLLSNEINLGYTAIYSPIEGLADQSRFREGSLINPMGDNLLTTVSVLDPIWIYFTISENDMLRAKHLIENHSIIFPKEEEFTVEAIMSDGSIFPYKGSLNFSSPTYDPTTGTILARASFPNPKNELRPGQFLRVKVYGAERPLAIVVPQRALMQKKDGMFVYLINQDQKVIAQDVALSEWVGDYQIVTNGLKAGDRVVVDGINKIFPGTQVKVVGAWDSQIEKKKEEKPL